MNLNDVVKRLKQGSRIPDVPRRQRTLAWVRFFSEVERAARSAPDEHDATADRDRPTRDRPARDLGRDAGAA